MKVLRTPEERFAGLPGFGYPPRYADVGGVRVAYVEAGPADGEPVLLLHGEPSWSYLFRTVLPVLAGAGLGAIPPALVGCARSPTTRWTCAGSPSSGTTGADCSACGWRPSTRTGWPGSSRPTPACRP